MMVTSAATMDAERFTVAPTKFRRSRRLSSTRGLIRSYNKRNSTDSLTPINSPESQRQSPKQNLCTSTPEKDVLTEKTMNWELNERISLSSGSSMGIEIHPDTKKGIGFTDRHKKTCPEPSKNPSSCAISKQTLNLLNVSGFPVHSDKSHHQKSQNSRSSTIKVYRERSVDGHVIKSDSKYEIGVPGECTMLRKKKKPQIRPSCNQVTTTQPTKSSMTLMKNDRNDLTGTASRRRWDNVSKEKLDKNSDSITKRLELIHELNQKILANYERFQHKSKRPGKSETPKGSLKTKDPEASKPRSVLSDLKEVYESNKNKEEHIYSDVLPKSKTKQASSRKHVEATSMVRETRDDIKYKSTKDRQFGDRMMRSTQERLESLQNKSKSSVSWALRNLGGVTSSKTSKKPPATNENFSLVAKPEFHVDTKTPTGEQEQGESPIKKLRSKFEDAQNSIKQNEEISRSQRSHQKNDEARMRIMEEEDSIKSEATADCLENSRLYPETLTCFSQRSIKDEVSGEKGDSMPSSEMADDRYFVATLDLDDEEDFEKIEERAFSFESSVTKIDNQRKLIESRRQEILEKEILDNLNETIDRFDNENESGNGDDKMMETQVDEVETSGDDTESFSTDSIQTTISPTSKLKSKENTCLHETFNSSWDSGVGIDVGTGNGWVRIHTGIESSLVYLTLDTTAKDVCRDMLLGDDLSLYMQVSQIIH